MRVGILVQNVSMRCKVVTYFNFFMADGRHLKNRKIALSHDDAERVSPAHLSSWIFIINFFSTACVREKPVLYHCAKFRGDRPYVCRDAAIFAIGFTR